MINRQAITTCITLFLVLAGLLPSVGIVAAQDIQPPADPRESWTPPESDGGSYMEPGMKANFDASSALPESSSGSTVGPNSAYYPHPPYLPFTPSILSAEFIDDSGAVRSSLRNEPFFLRVRVNTPGAFYLAEYFPSDSGMSPHWLMYRYQLDRAGMWTLGPFYPDDYEPLGRHTWRMWLYSAGMWAQRQAHFDYRPSPAAWTGPSLNPAYNSGWSTLQITIVMVLVGALGITIGMLISRGRRPATG